MPETSLAFLARRGTNPDVVAPDRTRIAFGKSNDLSRSAKFTSPGRGQDTSLAVNLNLQRRPKFDQPVERAVGVDTQEARLEASQGIKVRLGGPEDSEGQPILPKTIEGIKSALEELKTEQIINTEQALSISNIASQDMNDALITIMNIVAAGASTPQEVYDLLSKPEIDETANFTPDEQKANAARIADRKEEEWRSYEPIKDMETYRITHQGVDMDIVLGPEYRDYANQINSYIRTKEGYFTNSSKKARVLLLKPSSARTYLSSKRSPYILAVSHRAVIDKEDVQSEIDRVLQEEKDQEEAEEKRNEAKALAEAAVKAAKEAALKKKEAAEMKKKADEKAAKEAALKKMEDDMRKKKLDAEKAKRDAEADRIRKEIEKAEEERLEKEKVQKEKDRIQKKKATREKLTKEIEKLEERLDARKEGIADILESKKPTKASKAKLKRLERERDVLKARIDAKWDEIKAIKGSGKVKGGSLAMMAAVPLGLGFTAFGAMQAASANKKMKSKRKALKSLGL
jgi:hypothetical protein